MKRLYQLSLFVSLLNNFSTLILYQQYEFKILLNKNFLKFKFKKRYLKFLNLNLFCSNFLLIYNFNYELIKTKININTILSFLHYNKSFVYFINLKKFINIFNFKFFIGYKPIFNLLSSFLFWSYIKLESGVKIY